MTLFFPFLSISRRKHEIFPNDIHNDVMFNEQIAVKSFWERYFNDSNVIRNFIESVNIKGVNLKITESRF